MIRKIIEIDEEKCVGCGLCVNACNEGAIGLVDGKAKLLRDDYCDGLGNCLPVCPTDAISFIEREANAYDENEVKKKKEREYSQPNITTAVPTSQLHQWPVQIKLVPENAPYFDGAKLLIAADCTAYAYANIHNEFMKGKITLIGCPKLDDGDYAEKLTSIIKNNNIKSVTVLRMEVPCCAGISNAVITALKNSEKMIPWQVVIVSTEGQLIDD